MTQEAVNLSDCWKEIPSIPGYFARRDGELLGRSGKILRQKKCKRGYFWIGLTGGKNVSVARAICEAFHGCGQGLDVDHINRVRGDNRPENLRWVSREDNLKNRECASGHQHPNSKLTENDVRAIRGSKYFRGFDSAMARRFGVSRETIRDVRNYKQWVNLK